MAVPFPFEDTPMLAAVLTLAAGAAAPHTLHVSAGDPQPIKVLCTAGATTTLVFEDRCAVKQEEAARRHGWRIVAKRSRPNTMVEITPGRGSAHLTCAGSKLQVHLVLEGVSAAQPAEIRVTLEPPETPETTASVEEKPAEPPPPASTEPAAELDLVPGEAAASAGPADSAAVLGLHGPATPLLEAAWDAERAHLYLANRGPMALTEIQLDLGGHRPVRPIGDLQVDRIAVVTGWQPPPPEDWRPEQVRLTARIAGDGRDELEASLPVEPYDAWRPAGPQAAATAAAGLQIPADVRELEIGRIDRREGLPGQRKLVLEDVVRDDTTAWFRMVLKGGASDTLERVSWEHGDVATHSAVAEGEDLRLIVQLPRERLTKKSKLQIVFQREGRYTVPLKSATFTRFLKDLF